MTSHQLQVNAIKNGTVIDHIVAGQALKIIHILRLPSQKKLVTLGLNLPSHSLKYKDLIKVEDREITPEEANRIAILAPHATINIIHDYKIIKKFTVALPQHIDGYIVCPNQKCITNHERMTSVFKIYNPDQVKLQCAYCEKVFAREEITAYNI